MKKLLTNEIKNRLKLSSEKTGYIYSLTDDPNLVNVYCPKHNFSKLQNKNYAFQARKISCCNKFSPISKKDIDEYIEKVKIENPMCEITYNEFNGSNTIVKIYCSIHKTIRKIKYSSFKHKITKYACNKCSHEKYNRNFEYTKYKWIKKAKEVHGNKYDYSEMEDKGIKRTIICKKHGPFVQSIRNHVYYGNGCPKCIVVPSISSKENEIFEWLVSIGLQENIDFIIGPPENPLPKGNGMNGGYLSLIFNILPDSFSRSITSRTNKITITPKCIFFPVTFL